MFFAKWVLALKNRKSPRTIGYRRRGPKSRPPFTSDFFQMEDRCLLTTYTPMLPISGTMQGEGLSKVLYAPELDPNFNQANLPDPKLVTIMNNGSNVIFPIFQGTNTTPDNTAGTVTRALINGTGGAGYHGSYQVTFSLGSGPNPVAATATAEGNGNLYSITLVNPGSGYLPGDQPTATITPIGNAPAPATPAVVTAHVSNLTLAQNGNASLYDPQDPLTNTYRGYIGETVNGQYQLGLQPGHQVTVQVPIAFWDGGRIYMVDNGSVPLTSSFDPGFPLQANAEWSYNPSLTPDALAKLGSGRSYVVAPTSPGDKPYYGATFADPTTGYANPNGVVMWYHEEPYPGVVGKAAAHGFGFGVPAVLTEATFRDPKQPFIAPNMRPDQIFYIDNYDVSYVDSLAMPASMEATQVPSTPPTPGGGQFSWLGSDLSTTQMQQAIEGFTTNNTSVHLPTPPNPNGLGTYFGGLGWDQFYMPSDNTSTAGGTITQINNSNTAAPVTIITTSTKGLVNGGAVTISDVTGDHSDEINGTWIISNITPTSFALAGLPGNGIHYTGGKWTTFQTTGVHLQKLPAGYDSISESANLNVLSQFDSTRYSLQSGGAVENIGTIGTGVSTAGSNAITGVSTAIARQLVAGMLLAPAGNLAGKQLFPYGTTISRIKIGTAGNNDSTLIMSKSAAATGSPGNTAGGGSWLFFGSQFSTLASPSAMQGTIAANDNQITGLDPNVGMYLRPGLLVSGDGIQDSSNTYIKSISADFTSVTLTQNGTPTGGSGPYTFVGSPSSYVLQALINNWYAWADYYVAQLSSGPAAAPTGTFAAKTRTNGGRTDFKSLFLDITDPNFDMNQLRIGDVVTSALSTTLNSNSTGSPATPGYDPSLNYTIVRFDQVARTVELSLPVKATTAVPDSFTFTPPQYIIRSSDAPAAAPVPITSIGTTTGQAFTINTSSTAGLVNGMDVTISGVTDQATNLPADVNGRWIITNVVPNSSFQLQGADTAKGEKLVGGIWTTTAGTIPYTLNFNQPTTTITNISNASGQPITITTGSTVGLLSGEQITVSGVTGQTGINGTWTIKNITPTTFELAGITGTGGPVGNGLASSGGNWSPANPLQFAQTVYDVMQTMSLLVDPTTQASRSASLLGYVIGGNTGSFVINEAFFEQTGRHTLLPDERTALQLRDEIKSLLRGVYDFNAIPDQSRWYPDPAKPTQDATLNGTNITYGIYNLDPYVWFVHDVLHNSSYGFSFDDDVANAQAASSTLQIAVGGNAFTAPDSVAPNVLPNPEAFSPFAPWGSQQSSGYFDTTSSPAKDNAQIGQSTISGLSQAAVSRLIASDPKKDRPGAFITTDNPGLLPAGVTIVQTSALPAVTQKINSLENSSGQPVRINTTNTGNLATGDLVTISGVSGQTAINGRWLVANLNGTTSFELVGITGDGTASSGGTWEWKPGFVTFQTPENWTVPTDHANHEFTFSAFLGTTVPANISSSVLQAPKGTVVTINGNGFTGVYGVSFNGYAGTIVGGAITSTTNTIGQPIIIGAADTNGLTNGDTVTISNLIDETTGKPAAINGSSYVIANRIASTSMAPGSFELANSTGDGHTLGGGSWIAGNDTSFKAIVPGFVTNSSGTTYPGPIGKIAVRNQSGTNYSSEKFTIIAPEIDILGNTASIADGDTTPSAADHTDFGSTEISTGFITRTFTIQNSGTDNLNLGGGLVSVSGANADEFIVSTLLTTVVPPSGSLPFQVVFDPKATGLRTAVITVSNDDTDESSYEFVVQGMGTATPTVINPISTKIDPTKATLGGTVTDSGGVPLTKRGILYSVTTKNDNPTLGGSDVTVVDSAETTTGAFTENISGLAPGTSYSFVAFATNSVGTTTLSSVSTFTTLTRDQRFVYALYREALGREGSQGEVASWVGHLGTYGRAAVASGIEQSAEARRHLVSGWYQKYLGRTAATEEAAAWANLILNGFTEQQALSSILESAEYYSRAQTVATGSSADAKFIRSLYQDLLNRPGSDSEVASWSVQLPALGRAGVAQAILGSIEARGIYVDSLYEALLNRPSDAAGRTGWLLSQLDGVELRTSFERSEEFYLFG